MKKNDPIHDLFNQWQNAIEEAHPLQAAWLDGSNESEQLYDVQGLHIHSHLRAGRLIAESGSYGIYELGEPFNSIFIKPVNGTATAGPLKEVSAHGNKPLQEIA